MSDPIALVRLRARGDLKIVDTSDGWHVNYWPKGQRGNPFCGRGWGGDDLVALLVQAEEETRPPSRTIEDARYWTQWQAEQRQKSLTRQAERERQEQEKREAEEARRAARLKKREQERVRRVLEDQA